MVTASPDTPYTESQSYSAYLFTGISSSADVTKYLIGATYDLDAFQNAALDSNTATMANNMMNFAAKPVPDKSFANQDVTGYMVILNNADIKDATYFQVAKINGTGAEAFTVSFGQQGDKTMAWGPQAANTAWSKVESVPEPTSAMLLLLGVAGLALRRRRA